MFMGFCLWMERLMVSSQQGMDKTSMSNLPNGKFCNLRTE